MSAITFCKNYVDDEVGYLSKEDINYINKLVSEIDKKNGGQVVVLTRKTIGDAEVEHYCADYFRKWKGGIGDSKKNNGILILIVEDIRRLQIMWGYGVKARYSGSEMSYDIKTPMLNLLKEDKKSEAIITGVKSSIKKIDWE